MIDWLLTPYRKLRHAIGTVLRRRLRLRRRVVVPDMEIARFEHDFEVAAYFPDGVGNLYQLEQWLIPLERLNEEHPVVILTRSHRSFLHLRDEIELPVAFVRRVSDLDDFVANGNIKLALYVNHARSNFQMLRYGEMLHAHIGHGESEKASMASHQIRAYDYAFVAGSRAIERYAAALLEFDDDLRGRQIEIGRPQLDVDFALEDGAGEHPMILYAPTWEGDRPTMRYSSVGHMGVRIVEEILRSGSFRLVYRPHPRTGDYDQGVEEANTEIIRMIEEASEASPGIGHALDTTTPLLAQIKESVIGIADVSAVTLDYLASSKPVIVTSVADELVSSRESKELLGVCYRLGPGDSAVQLVNEVLSTDPKSTERIDLAEEYFGDLSPGASLRRFLAACSGLIERRDQAQAKRLEH